MDGEAPAGVVRFGLQTAVEEQDGEFDEAGAEQEDEGCDPGVERFAGQFEGRHVPDVAVYESVTR